MNINGSTANSMIRPETPIFASKKSIHLDLSKSRISSFAETCGPSIKTRETFHSNSRRIFVKQQQNNEIIQKKTESLCDLIVDKLKFCLALDDEEEIEEVSKNIKSVIEDHFEKNEEPSGNGFGSDDLDEKLKNLVNEIEKISPWRFFHCDKFSRFSSVLLKNIENCAKRSDQMKGIIERFEGKLKILKNKIKQLFESIKISEVPEELKQVEVQNIKPKRKFSDLKLEKRINDIPEDLESLIVEMKSLESSLSLSTCKPKRAISRIIAIKNKIAEIKTKKIIKTNRELSQKVRRGIESIEKSWVLGEAKAATPKFRDRMIKENSRDVSPFFQSEKSSGFSPILSRTMNTSGFLSERSLDDQKDLNQLLQSVKQKEDALDQLAETKRNQENQLDGLIFAYKSKLFELEQERDNFLQVKAKAYNEVKKLKVIEEELKKKESNLNSSKGQIQETEVDIWMNLREKEKTVQEALDKINTEYKEIYKSQENLSKTSTVLKFRSSAINETWNFVKLSLKEFKALQI